MIHKEEKSALQIFIKVYPYFRRTINYVNMGELRVNANVAYRAEEYNHINSRIVVLNSFLIQIRDKNIFKSFNDSFVKKKRKISIFLLIS